MLKNAFSFAGTLLLAGAAVLMMPGLSQAQHGGGHGGGGHFGGGGAHFAGGGSHFTGSHVGGYRSGMYQGGTRLGGFHYGYGRYRPYYGGYGSYPYYGLYSGYYPYYDDSYPYLSSSPMYDSGYSNTYGDVVPDYGYGTAPAVADYQPLYPSSITTLQPDTAVHITVKAPADAQLRFNGTLTAGTGTVRQFESPPLAAGKYSYDIQAHWIENGQEVTENRQVEVTPGARVEVDFPAPPRTSEG